MRKLIAFTAIMMLAAGILTAGPFFQIGASASVGGNLGSSDTWSDIKSYGFGADIRINPLFFELDIPIEYTPAGNGMHRISLTPTLNVSVQFLDAFDIFGGAGLAFDFLNTGESWLLNGLSNPSFQSFFRAARLVYRAGISIHMGNTALSVAYLMPAKGTLDNLSFGIDTDSARIQTAVLFGF